MGKVNNQPAAPISYTWGEHQTGKKVKTGIFGKSTVKVVVPEIFKKPSGSSEKALLSTRTVGVSKSDKLFVKMANKNFRQAMSDVTKAMKKSKATTQSVIAALNKHVTNQAELDDIINHLPSKLQNKEAVSEAVAVLKMELSEENFQPPIHAADADTDMQSPNPLTTFASPKKSEVSNPQVPTPRPRTSSNISVQSNDTSRRSSLKPVRPAPLPPQQPGSSNTKRRGRPSPPRPKHAPPPRPDHPPKAASTPSTPATPVARPLPQDVFLTELDKIAENYPEKAADTKQLGSYLSELKNAGVSSKVLLELVRAFPGYQDAGWNTEEFMKLSYETCRAIADGRAQDPASAMAEGYQALNK
jgi:uncharacterized membrane-anchored protein YhcB (DUF1043 family)